MKMMPDGTGRVPEAPEFVRVLEILWPVTRGSNKYTNFIRQPHEDIAEICRVPVTNLCNDDATAWPRFSVIVGVWDGMPFVRLHCLP